MMEKEGGGRRFLSMLGFGTRGSSSAAEMDPTTAGIAQGPDNDTPAPGQQFAAFGAGCFWGVELAYQRVPGVTKTEVGYTQGYTHNPSYNDVCSGTTGRNALSLSLSLSLFSQNHD
jgi:peptide-methionine (S)-S-oxide reductase